MRGPTIIVAASSQPLRCRAAWPRPRSMSPPRRSGSQRKAVDLATTSQSEADEKRGREMRQREERLGKLQREFDKLQTQVLAMATAAPASSTSAIMRADRTICRRHPVEAALTLGRGAAQPVVDRRADAVIRHGSDRDRAVRPRPPPRAGSA